MNVILGCTVMDSVTGIKGIVVARVEYLNGCVQFCVQPRVAADATNIDSLYIDAGQLTRIGDGISKPLTITGGSFAHAPRGQKHP